MNEKMMPLSAVDRYTSALRNGRKNKLPPNYPQPQPPSAWPLENTALLERYLDWLIADGAGHTCILQFYIPMAGHVLGYHLQPHEQLDLQTDLACAMDFLRAKQVGERWLEMGHHALTRFRRFLQEERGIKAQPIRFKQANVTRYHEGVPAWLVEQLTQYQHIRQANWRPARLCEAILRFWSNHTRLWRWLFAHHPIHTIGDIKRAYVFAYMDERLAAGYSPKGVNQDVRCFQATLHFLHEREFAIPQALLRLRGLKEPDSLPRFLADEQVGKLQTDLDQRMQQAKTETRRRNALLDRAAFYLLWQGGLRLGEVEELHLEDLNLAHKQLLIRQGKGRKDRAVYLTERAVNALQAFLDVRGTGSTEHVFLYRHLPVSKDLIRDRIKAAGKRTGVKITPHRLRHTYATQLVNAGCKITTIQALLGHQHLNTTMTYARVYDSTVAEDYYAAMAVVEKRLADQLPRLSDQNIASNETNPSVNGNGRDPLLQLVAALQAESLNDNQQALLTELRQRITAITKQPTIIFQPPERFVNEQRRQQQPLVELQPP
ncbi:MAG: site-specific integrase [Chloroflexi bacterium]|nr:site-specific integrase [Chloroflexota bacterium]